MENESENNITDIAEPPIECVESEAVTDADTAPVATVETKSYADGKKRRPLIKSVATNAMVSYFLFSIIVLVLYFGVFFSCMYWFYGNMTEQDTEQIERSAAGGFPKRISDNSMVVQYKHRLVEVARNNKPVAIAVFETGETGKYDICVIVDDMGNGISDNSDLFDSVMENLDFADVFERGNMIKVNTPFGTYLCKGSAHETEDSGTAYLLVMKPFDVWNNQTIKIINVLLACAIIVLILSCAFAYLMSRHETKHLTDFSQKAKRLAGGDYNVVFSGYGYNEYENLANALNSATQNIQNAEKLQRDIIANVSHDIRTPLTMIRAYAEMLRDMPMNDDKREKTANVIITEADRLTSLVSDVLDYSKLESGVSDYKLEPCDLASVATTVLERFDIARERDGYKLLHDIDDDATVTCDKQKIEQVFYNLVSNAINYCGDDKTVILRVKKQDGIVRVEVTDHGSGIDEKDIDSVWDRYYRSPHSTRTAVGTGLGLSICKSVLTAHGAEFGVISEIGKGSTFWFELK